MMRKGRTHKPPLVPIERPEDVDTVRWLTRESFETAAARDGLHLVEYTERQVPVDEVPAGWADILGRPLTDYQWWQFTGRAEMDVELFDWLAAEHKWREQQTADWLAAEQQWTARQRHAQRRAAESVA